MSELKDLQIEEVSVVDNGANPSAKIKIVKRQEKGEKKSEAEEILTRLTKKLEEQVQKAEALEMLNVAKKYELLGEKAEDLAPTLQKIKNESAQAYETLIEKMDAALDVINKSQAFEEVGKSGTQTTDVTIEKMLEQVKKERPELSDRWALDEAYKRMEASK